MRELLLKYKKIPVQTKAAFWFMFCTMIPQAITVLTTAIFTRLLTTEDYGITSNYSAWYNIISIFITFNLNCGVYNNAMLKYEKKRDEYDASMMGLSIVLGAVGGIIFILFHFFWESIMSLPLSLIICMTLQAVFYNPYGCMLSRTKYEYNYRKLIKITFVTSLISPILAILFVLIFNVDAVAKVWGQTLVYIILGAGIYVNIFLKEKKLYNKEFWKYALRFNLPLIPHYLSLIILNQSDRIMITKICGAEDNGFYSVAYSAASMLLIFNSSITQAFTPWVYGKCRDKNVKKIKKYVRMLYLIMVGIIVLFIFAAPEIIAVLASKKYSESIYVIPPVAASMFFIFLYNMLSILEFYHEKTKPVMVCSMFSAGFNLILNMIFIPQYGYIAAAYTTLVCYVLNIIMHYFVVFQIYKRFYSLYDDFYCIRESVFIGVGMIIFAITCLFFYHYFLLRWGIIIIVLCILGIKHKTIIQLIKKEL